MVIEVKTLKQKIVDAVNEAKLPPVVAQLVVESVLADINQYVMMQEAAEATAAAAAEYSKNKKAGEEDGAV